MPHTTGHHRPADTLTAAGADQLLGSFTWFGRIFTATGHPDRINLQHVVGDQCRDIAVGDAEKLSFLVAPEALGVAPSAQHAFRQGLHERVLALAASAFEGTPLPEALALNTAISGLPASGHGHDSHSTSGTDFDPGTPGPGLKDKAQFALLLAFMIAGMALRSRAARSILIALIMLAVAICFAWARTVR